MVLTGALPAAEGATPGKYHVGWKQQAESLNVVMTGMIGYGIAKAAVHHLVKDLAAKGSGLPDASKVIGLCP